MHMRIEFHFNAPQLVPYACRLLRKIHRLQLRVQVVGHPTTLALLDAALWTADPSSFLPHCHAQDGPHLRQASPIWLCPEPCTDGPQQVLVNLGEGVPVGYEGFARVIDVVSVDDLHRAQGRERWRTYASRGCDLVRFDLASSSSPAHSPAHSPAP